MGITSTGDLYISSWGNGPSGSTAIVQCSGLVELQSLSDYSCENVYDPITPIPNSNDPYVYVDPWTDRIMKFDMHALLGMTVEWSDDEEHLGHYQLLLQDILCKTIKPLLLHHIQQLLTKLCGYFVSMAMLRCHFVQRAKTAATHGDQNCSGAPVDCQSGGLSAHIIGAENGNFYRGQKGCDGEGYSMYRTNDGAITWTEHVLPTEESGTADTWNAEEAQVDTDSESNVYAMWMGIDDLPYFSYSTDNAETWSDAMMIAPSHLVGTGFPVVIAGDPGE